ncbi:hypothetical protein [Plantactinospora sp. GCM10030261]|uniref:hypothetical protein n=1 Tax=Plantactinospora sp. GCM10030261 TaxID=3273420 RepID=UPI00361D69B0
MSTMLHNPFVDVPGLLRQACRTVPGAAATEAGVTVHDVHEYLGYHEWEIALDILAELGDATPTTAEWWQLLQDAAMAMQRTRMAAWCGWRRWEAVHGIIRADLALFATDNSGRRTPIPGAGVLRPLWAIGHHTPAGEPDLRIARIWVENASELVPGTTGSIRLAPLDPTAWSHLRPGDLITMHESRPPAGTAMIVKVAPGRR